MDRGSDGSDAEDASSGYSSCEGSEFERYCSANSVFGSSSQCSSVGTFSECLDSAKDHTEGCSIREKFHWCRWNGDISTSGGYDCLSDGGVESPRENGRSESTDTTSVIDPLPRIRTGSKLFSSLNENSLPCKGDCSSQEGVCGRGIGGNSSNGFLPCASICEERMDFDKNSGGDCTGFVSNGLVQRGMMLEASGGDDSMLDYGTDDDGPDGRAHFYKINGSEPTVNTEPRNENPFLINSAVAFGSNDWDDFMQESGENGFMSLSLYQDKPVKQQEGSSMMDGNLLVPSMDRVNTPFLHEMDQNEVGDILATNYEGEVINRSHNDVGNCSVRKPSNDHEGTEENKSLKDQEGDINSNSDCHGRNIQCSCSEKVCNTATVIASEKKVICESELSRSPLCDGIAVQSYSTLTGTSRGKEVEAQDFDNARSFLPMDNIDHDSSVQNVVEENSNSSKVFEEDLVPDEVNELDTYSAYDEMVLEMEEILLDSGKSHGSKFSQAYQGYITQQSHHFRDGSSTASTSGTDDASPHVHCPAKIDWIEVVGAKQKQGDVSFGERLVGVKEHTVYKLRVRSGKDQWEVERRYRDFYALYRQLKTLFTDHGLNLPSPWSHIELDSRKIFGNASPTVISERSALIQNCLRSVLNGRYPFGLPNSLVCFLTPSKEFHSDGLLKALIPQYLQKLARDEKANFSNCENKTSVDISMFGKTISLVVEIKPRRSLRELLEAQNYSCAGCHRHLDAGKTLLREIVQTFRWNKPRFCEYTGQLFCASCHTNDTAVLPARVLHRWDFSLYPVSQLAKAYLESVYGQPMLCVSAVNPFLFSKVPALHHVVGIRKKIGAMIPYVRCPFRRSIHKGLGLRRHILESNDFFALRDLVDLSKGAFAALPVMLETISSKIFEHITQQCLECYDTGIPCAARQACNDPSSLIFPFQEAEAARCSSCGSIFHKPCFVKVVGCPCNATTEPDSHGAREKSSVQPSDSNSAPGFFSDILSKARPDKIWKPKNGSPVILMGSLPGTAL